MSERIKKEVITVEHSCWLSNEVLLRSKISSSDLIKMILSEINNATESLKDPKHNLELTEKIIRSLKEIGIQSNVQLECEVVISLNYDKLD